MDIDDEVSFFKMSYKCEEPVLDNLNIIYNSSNSKLVLWNKYQIFVYEDTEFKSVAKIFIPEFQIHLLIASNNYLLCLDCSGNVHITSLKFKTSTQKTLKIPRKSRDEGIKICKRYKEDHLLSLKYEADTYFLCSHKINTELQMEKKVILLCNNEHWPLGDHPKQKYLLTSHSIKKDNFDHINKIFKTDETFSHQNLHELVVLSIDKINIYGCLFSPKLSGDEITLAKLYSCPAEICNIDIDNSGDLQLLISLTMGTIIRLRLNGTSKTPDIVHLNTALYKMLPLKDCLIYSDGTTMWKSENTFSDIKLTQLFIRNVNDFVPCGDQIICTTYNKLIYKLTIDNQSSYLYPKSDEYCSAEKLFNNYEYLNKLFQEIDKNNEVVTKLEKEQQYITAISLSKRQDIVMKAIESSVNVFETYEEACTKKYTLAEDVKEYFAPNIWIFSVSITNSGIYETLNNILSKLSDSMMIYITLSALKVLKTTCIKMEEAKTVNYLIPLYMTNETEVNVNIKIVINIPGALDMKKAFTVLYKKDILLKSEHFIKTSQKTINTMKNTTESTDELILKLSEIQHGDTFIFTDTTNLEESEIEYSFYVKLPNDYDQIFKANSNRYLTPKMTLILQEFSAEEFLKSKKHIMLSICNKTLKVNMHNDGFSNPLLKITSTDAMIALNIRNFLAKVIHDDNDYEPGKEFIGYSYYTTTENFQKAIKSCISRSATLEEVLPLMDQFEKNIIGALPL